MNAPKFSIIINNYNYERFVGQAIESCLAQSRPAHEIIIVDDGSTDDSRRIINQYAERPAIKIIFQKNQGQEAALQTGFDAASGDFILTLDSDDYYKPDCIEQLAQVVEDDIDWLYFRAEDIDQNGNFQGVRPSLKRRLMTGIVWEDWVVKGKVHTFPPQSFNCFSRRLTKSIKLFPNPVVGLHSGISPDAYLHLFAAFFGKVLAVEKVLGSYRNHPQGFSKLTAGNLKRVRLRMLSQKLAEQEAARLLSERTVNKKPNFVSYSPRMHYAERLLSLVCEPKEHPFPNDRRLGLLYRIIKHEMTGGNIDLKVAAKVIAKQSVIAFSAPGFAWRVHTLNKIKPTQALAH